ncbi:hypothetical protein [Corynebacterium glucuronolyticum]|nr:hypothetical protein [Corynebacterium glucuronolyticum]MCT1442614.1 hypothetical protein [Corynebacterium glucuronolyticum]
MNVNSIIETLKQFVSNLNVRTRDSRTQLIEDIKQASQDTDWSNLKKEDN